MLRAISTIILLLVLAAWIASKITIRNAAAYTGMVLVFGDNKFVLEDGAFSWIHRGKLDSGWWPRTGIISTNQGLSEAERYTGLRPWYGFDELSIDRLHVHLLWPLLLALAGLAVSFLRRRRAAAGRCVKCGYDLRGTPTGQCPECGADNKPSPAAGRSKQQAP